MELVMDLLDIVLRSLLSVIVLFLLTKLMGQRQISQLSFFDYVIGISIGSIAAQMAVDDGTEYEHAIVAMVVYAGVAILISLVTIKSIKFRRFVTGTPMILIQNGQILEKNLKRSKLDINDLLSECRTNGYFNVNDIAYAIIETNGKLSLLPKAGKRPANTEELNLAVAAGGLVANLIIDGKIMPNNLKKIGRNEEWLQKELSKQKVKAAKDVFLATFDIESGDLSLHLKNSDSPVTENVFE